MLLTRRYLGAQSVSLSQVYSANWLSKDPFDAPHTQHRALCLETQNFPDAVHARDGFPSAVLRPGEVYAHRTVHEFALVPPPAAGAPEVL